ncbi:hypothetical protein FQR65_LT15460 [Abscondita terminalis]|nr:hypothetical protein FQR65_LT15460 [Abscondita terminalis]
MSRRSLVVNFIEENTVSVIPENWMCGGYYCYWPKTSIVGPLIKQRAAPKHNCDKFKSLSLAQRKVSKAETTSDLSTDEKGTSSNAYYEDTYSQDPPDVMSFAINGVVPDNNLPDNNFPETEEANITLTPTGEIDTLPGNAFQKKC